MAQGSTAWVFPRPTLCLWACVLLGESAQCLGVGRRNKKRDEGPGALLTRKMEVSSSPVLFHILLLYRNTATAHYLEA